ncbi:hypothetical protein GCM10010205_77340 [Streptomyces nojiriensis]|nr:hypothetical protein GCM10010205_77340 [Streptomyces nojiriensis]
MGWAGLPLRDAAHLVKHSQSARVMGADAAARAGTTAFRIPCRTHFSVRHAQRLAHRPQYAGGRLALCLGKPPVTDRASLMESWASPLVTGPRKPGQAPKGGGQASEWGAEVCPHAMPTARVRWRGDRWPQVGHDR